MEKIKIEEYQEKYQFKLSRNRDGEEGFRIGRNEKDLRENPKLLAEIKAAKPEIMDYLKNLKKEEEELLEQEIQIALAANIVGYTHITGCDCRDTDKLHYDYTENISYDAIIARDEKDQKLLDCIKLLSRKEMPENIGTALEADLCSYGGVEYNQAETAILIGIAKEKMIAMELQREKNIQAKEREVALIFEKARETGEKQLLKNYFDCCNNPNEECDIDSICIYAMPDGTKTETRSHTW